jgi:hypothetical protein
LDINWICKLHIVTRPSAAKHRHVFHKQYVGKILSITQNFVWKKYFCNGNNLFTSEILIHTRMWVRVGFSNIYVFVCKYFCFSFWDVTENLTIPIPYEFIYPIEVFINSAWWKCLQSTFLNIHLQISEIFPCPVTFYRKSKCSRWMLTCGCIWQNKVTR